jgi:hypothetical protein
MMIYVYIKSTDSMGHWVTVDTSLVFSELVKIILGHRADNWDTISTMAIKIGVTQTETVQSCVRSPRRATAARARARRPKRDKCFRSHRIAMPGATPARLSPSRSIFRFGSAACFAPRVARYAHQVNHHDGQLRFVSKLGRWPGINFTWHEQTYRRRNASNIGKVECFKTRQLDSDHAGLPL